MYNRKWKSKKSILSQILEKVNKYYKKSGGISDNISKLTNQYVSGIRVLKYYGWEDIAIGKISKQRAARNELSMKSGSLEWKVNSFLDLLLDGYTAVTISFLYITGFIITLPLYLFIKSMIDIIRGSIWDMFYTYKDFQSSYFSLQRLANILEAEEKEQSSERAKKVKKGQIIMKRAKFFWSTERAEQEEAERKKIKEIQEKLMKSVDTEGQQKSKNPQQQKKQFKQMINLEIEQFHAEPGTIVGIVGKVGCGKSTLISAIIAEIAKVEILENEGTSKEVSDMNNDCSYFENIHLNQIEQKITQIRACFASAVSRKTEAQCETFNFPVKILFKFAYFYCQISNLNQKLKLLASTTAAMQLEVLLFQQFFQISMIALRVILHLQQNMVHWFL